MKKLISFLAVGYVVCASTMLWLAVRAVAFIREDLWAQSIHRDPARLSFVPSILFVMLFTSAALLLVCSSLAYLLFRRRHRNAALLMAAGSCIAIPLGTLLGPITLIALTRPEVRSTFATHTPTI
jgi:hypothetical protein